MIETTSWTRFFSVKFLRMVVVTWSGWLGVVWVHSAKSDEFPATLSFSEPFKLDQRSLTLGQFGLGLESSQYISANQPAYRPEAKASNQSVVALIRSAKSFKGIKAIVDVRAEYSSSENWFYPNIHNLYLQKKLGSRWSVELGRREWDWSFLDREWKQGLIEPRYRQNMLRPQAAGLVGLFIDRRQNNFSFRGGYLPFFVPDFGPGFRLIDRSFVSYNPWFSPPASEFLFNDASGEVRYSIKNPKTRDVLFNPGWILNTSWNFNLPEQQKVFGQLTLARKPLSQILLGFPFNRLVVGASTDFIDIEVTPRVLYHNVLSVEQGFQQKGFSILGSFLYDEPDQENFVRGFTAQTVTPAKVVGLQMRQKLEQNFRGLEGQLAILRVFGGDGPDRGEFARGRELFERRFQFTNALSLGLSSGFKWIRPGHFQTKIVFDQEQNGVAWLNSLVARMNSAWTITAEADFLGLLKSSTANEGFLAKYRANDRIGIGTQYAF